jgi:hypothetical protein
MVVFILSAFTLVIINCVKQRFDGDTGNLLPRPCVLHVLSPVILRMWYAVRQFFQIKLNILPTQKNLDFCRNQDKQPGCGYQFPIIKELYPSQINTTEAPLSIQIV